ncbi:hypothetical protein B0H12DRAFT_1000674, partial [Mycena haematopus]
AKGVAIVLNKNMLETANIRTREIDPGRAMLTELTNVDGSNLSILGIYAPNAPGENASFWVKIKTYFENNSNVRRPDIMTGDFNMVEDAIDRNHARADNNGPVNTFDDLKIYFSMMDGWRETYPTTRDYTYHQTEAQGGAQSRLDRIYVKRNIFEHSFEWEIQTVGIKTDHRMVSMRLTTEDAPTIGHGRWVWPTHLNYDKVLREYIHTRGMQMQEEMAALWGIEVRDEDHNEQTVWLNFKTDIGTMARERAKILIPQLTQEITAVEDQIEAI